MAGISFPSSKSQVYEELGGGQGVYRKDTMLVRHLLSSRQCWVLGEVPCLTLTSIFQVSLGPPANHPAEAQILE